VTTVLLPLDGSTFAERALPAAAWLAGRLRADIFLISAIDSEDQRAAREDYLTEVADRLSSFELGETVVVPWSVVVDRDPAGAIHESRLRLGDAVVCLATHGRGRSAALIGSVAVEVVARGHDPLILVGPLVADPVVGTGVVACADEQPESARLVLRAVEWGTRLDEPVVAIVVAEPVPPPVRDRPAHRLFGPDGDVDAYVAALIAPVHATNPLADLRGTVVWDPVSPSDGVISYVGDQPAALVVVGSRLHHRLGHPVFGHTSAAIVHSCPSPVLVTPAAR
jgi:nucleotide-binding universal stress UspA family protein